MSRTHDITISGFDLDRIEAELKSVKEENGKLREALRGVLYWHSQSDEGLRLHCGELTAQEIRTIRAVLNAVFSQLPEFWRLLPEFGRPLPEFGHLP